MRIEDLVGQNGWWKFGKDFWKYDPDLKRVKEEFIEFRRRKIELKAGNVYIIRGIRQSGKTVYLKQTILDLLESGVDPNTILYISCDRLVSRRELRNILDDFIQTNRSARLIYILLDEITYLEDWNLELKTLADSKFMDRTIIMATGSSPARIKEKAERLPGRRVEGNEYFFKPLTFREFVIQSIDNLAPKLDQEFSESLKRLKAKIEKISMTPEEDSDSVIKKVNGIRAFKSDLDYMLGIYLLTGGFPATINEYLKSKFIKKEGGIKVELYETFMRIVLGDVSKLKRSETIGKEVMRGIIEKYTSRYSFTTLGGALGLPHQTVMDYLELLEDSFLIGVFYPLDISRKRLKAKGDKKIYFLDPFIYHSVRSFLTGENGFTLSKDSLLKEKSKLLEALVASALIQIKEVPYSRGWKTYLWSFYTHSGKEIDFVYKNRDLIGIEVKYAEEVDKREVSKINEVKKYLVLTKNQIKKFENMDFVPISLFLSLLKKSEKIL